MNGQAVMSLSRSLALSLSSLLLALDFVAFVDRWTIP